MSVQAYPMKWLPIFSAASETDWEALYRAELPKIYNYFRYRFGNDALAEDLAATTFEKAWRARNRYRRDLAGFSTWLHTIARNVGIDHARSHRHEISLDGLLERPSDQSPERDAVRNAEAARLNALLAALDDRERELVALKYGADLTNREIAKLTGISESNVGTILHRTVAALRKQWDGSGQSSAASRQ
jgi:RNA polymerase sigma-70 factor (ECF subfamily)